MAEPSNSGGTSGPGGASGSGWASGFVSAYSRGAIVPSRSAAEIAPEAAPITDKPGVVSSYTRGSIVPESSPEQVRPDFERGGDPAAVRPVLGRVPAAPLDAPRLPAPRLEMGGPMGQTVRNGIRQVQRTERRAALDKAYGANAVKRMMAMPMQRRAAVDVGMDFKQAMPKPKRHL